MSRARLAVAAALGAWLAPVAAQAGVTITLFHTNDVHSHFRSDRDATADGGLTRLATVIRNARAAVPDSLLIDGGDWSEGRIYYVEGLGAESLRLMDQLGYDAAVVGNHDWLNGPDHLLNAIADARPRLSLLGANFEMPSGYGRAEDFYSKIASYAIKTVRGVRIALIGVANFDPVYASYLSPVKTVDGGAVTERLARKLKSEGQTDVVVAVSHNGIESNQELLRAAPDVDLVIGGHDHLKLTQPISVSRPGHADAWVVEAGRWGRFLGQITLDVVPASGGAPAQVTPTAYRLLPVNRDVPEDPAISLAVAAIEDRIAAKMGPVFSDHVADCDDEIPNDTLEDPIGDLVTDAYRKATGADVALDQNRLIYDTFHAGPISSADVLNVMPAIYDPVSGKAWTLHTWTMSGETLSVFFHVVYGWSRLVTSGGMSFSGMELTYDPLKVKEHLGLMDVLGDVFATQGAAVRSLTIGGRPIEKLKTYKLAASAGVVEGIRMINQQYFDVLSLHNHVDTGVEDWRVLRDYVQAISPLSMDKVVFGGRVQTAQPDLGIVPGSVRWTPAARQGDGSVTARIELLVTNYGAAASPAGVSIDLGSNVHGYDDSVEPQLSVIGAAQPIAPMQPGESRSFEWSSVIVPAYHGLYPVRPFLHTVGETNKTNDSLTRFFER